MYFDSQRPPIRSQPRFIIIKATKPHPSPVFGCCALAMSLAYTTLWRYIFYLGLVNREFSCVSWLCLCMCYNHYYRYYNCCLKFYLYNYQFRYHCYYNYRFYIIQVTSLTK